MEQVSTSSDLTRLESELTRCATGVMYSSLKSSRSEDGVSWTFRLALLELAARRSETFPELA